MRIESQIGIIATVFIVTVLVSGTILPTGIFRSDIDSPNLKPFTGQLEWNTEKSWLELFNEKGCNYHFESFKSLNSDEGKFLVIKCNPDNIQPATVDELAFFSQKIQELHGIDLQDWKFCYTFKDGKMECI